MTSIIVSQNKSVSTINIKWETFVNRCNALEEQASQFLLRTLFYVFSSENERYLNSQELQFTLTLAEITNLNGQHISHVKY